MNDNPWHVDEIARMQRERIRDEIRQIRLEDRVARRPRLLVQIGNLIQRIAGSRQPGPLPSRPQTSRTQRAERDGV